MSNDSHMKLVNLVVETSKMGNIQKSSSGYYSKQVENFEKMIQDLKISEDFATNYLEKLQNLPIKLQFKLIGPRWDIKENNQQIILPNSLQQSILKFTYVFNSKYRDFKLNCIYDKGTADITIKNNAIIKEIDQIKELEDLLEQESDLPQQQTNIQNYIQSHNICLTFYTKIQQKERKIRTEPRNQKLNQNQSLLSKVEQDKLQVERDLIIDSQIVRIMKMKRKMNIQDLILETENFIKIFKPELKQIKRRIDQLITKEYMERDQENMQILNYKA
ncbi:Cullin homology [Pseudocohnilembus persalinus]|uniref:Cullin homology n=1 Tax=Pseudocohnilembus persalinus TaxID=266149 RepID=A0A0V0QGL9_PSEPJ|nr:Cullin homology [Pseudocohnilembus persalinus]|eukprot:KRX01339.1 Cullin homology [Pseudocohnilembus persalinus]